MAKYPDRDSFLNALFDHVFPEGEEVTDDDQDWFDNLAKFFEDEKSGEGNAPNPPRRRRTGNTTSASPPRRRRRVSSGSSSDSYGASSWWNN
jgi:hypothetical protein